MKTGFGLNLLSRKLICCLIYDTKLREKLQVWNFMSVNAGFVAVKAINFPVNIY